MAPSFLSGLFETKAASSSDAINRALGSSSERGGGSMPMRSFGAWDIDYAVTHGMERSIWVYRCVDTIASNQATVPLLVKSGFDRANGKVVDDERMWKLLNFRCNTYESSASFRYRLSINLLLSKRGAFVEVVKGRDGRPSELHLLPAGSTAPIPDPKTFVSGYEVQRADFKIDRLEPDQVIWLKLKNHPTDPYLQMTPMAAAGLATETDFFARLFNRNFLMNDGRPSTLITVHGNMNPDDVDIIRARFSGGPMRAGQTTVIEADGLDVADLSSTPRDMNWESMLSGSKSDILLAFGVPESVMGNASGRTFDNADAEKEGFWTDTMVTHVNTMAAGLDPLTGDISDDVVIAADYSGIEVLQRVATKKREEWRTEVTAGVRTIDEYLEAVGREPWGVLGTKVLWQPNGFAIAPTKEDQARVAQELVPIGNPAPPDPTANARLGAEQGSQMGMRTLSNMMAARAALVGSKAMQRIESKSDIVDAEVIEEKTHPYLGLRYRLEGEVEGIVTSWDSRQEAVVTERLLHVKSRKNTRHWDGPVDGEVKALDPTYAVNVDQWANELKVQMEAVVGRVVRKEMAAAARDMAQTGVLDKMTVNGAAGTKGTALGRLVGNDRDTLAASIIGNAMDIVDAAARNQSKRIAQKIEQLDQDGASMKTIEREVRKMIGSRAPWRKDLATNITTSAIESARTAVYGKAGPLLTKTWNTVEDERVRATHRQVDQKSVPATKAFKVGRSDMQHPGDYTAPIEEVVNCRCWLTWTPNFDLLGQ